MKNNYFLAAFAVILLAGAFFRFYQLDLRPAHHDEGVTAISFVRPILETGDYRHNPTATYHGPFLFYVGAVSFAIFGINEFALRFGQALFGIATVALVYMLRRHLGDIGTLAAAGLLALSAATVYYSRFISHEIYLVFFQLLAIISFLRFSKEKNPNYLYLTFASLGFMFVSKESAYGITFLFASFFAGRIILQKSKKTYPLSIKENISSVVELTTKYKKNLLAAILISFIIMAVFFTSFFRYPDNFGPSLIGPVQYWLKTTNEFTGHHKPFFYYTDILLKFELPVVILALAGLLYCRKNLFATFSAYLFVSTWLLFSSIAYKTPWLIVHIMLPLALVAGIGAQELYRKIGKYAIPILAIAIVYTAWISYNVNYIDHSGQFNQLAYVTTAPDFLDMVNRIYTFDRNAEIKVQSPEQWPLAWYLRDYKRAGYYGQILDDPNADIIIIKKEDREKLEPKLNRTYESADYQLRWGVWLSAYFRQRGKL